MSGQAIASAAAQQARVKTIGAGSGSVPIRTRRLESKEIAGVFHWVTASAVSVMIEAGTMSSHPSALTRWMSALVRTPASY
jgi:hypothetical protein